MALRIIYEGDEAVAHSHLPRAQNLMHKVREFVTASGVGLHAQTLVLDDRSYTYCLKVDDLESIYIFSQPDPATSEVDENAVPILPELYSGVIRGGMIRTDTLPAIPPATGTRRVKKLEFFKPTGVTMTRNEKSLEPLHAGFQSVTKLAVEPNSIYFPEYIGGYGLESSDPTVPRKFSQYLNIRPSNYTGKMQKLAQVVLGYGYVHPYSVVGLHPNTKAEIVKSGLQIIYDFRWHRTHGVVTGGDGKLWLVEVSNLHGVLAMQLPIFEKSAQKLAETKWSDYQAIVEEFGGLPSGYGFPLPTKLKAEIEKGNILRLATVEQLRDFHSLNNFSSVCGWAFNESGSEAHNTGWNWGADGVKRTFHYRLDIAIGAIKPEREEGAPIAVASATLTMVSTGRMYHPSRIYPPPFKLHEPLLEGGGGLLSANFLSTLDGAEGPNVGSVKIVYDCPLYVYYADDQLKVVRYYNDRRTKPGTTVEDNFEPCMYVGAWQQTRTSGGRYIPVMFYTTDIDDREELPANITETTIVGADLGYYEKMGDHIDDIRYSDYYRDKWFRKTTTSVYNEDQGLSSSVIVPNGLRNGIVYGLYRSVASSYTHKSISYDSLRDPNWYGGFRALYSEPPKNDCYVKDVRKVWRMVVAPGTQCENDFANNGHWKGFCDVVPENLAPFPMRESSSTTPRVAKHNISVTLYTDVFGKIELQKLDSWSAHRERSPNDEGYIQQMSCVHTGKIGAQQIYYATALNPTGRHYAARGNMMGDAVSADESRAYSYNFVGVL